MVPYLQPVSIDVPGAVAPIVVTSSQLCIGLNADLLDGQHASAFALASHTHPYLPLTGGTLTGPLVMSAPIARIIFSETDQVGDTWGLICDTDAFAISRFDRVTNNWKSSVLYCPPSGSLQYNGATVWTAANDGSGSGLDADTVDGLHAGSFALVGHLHDDRYVRLTGSTMTGSLVAYTSEIVTPTLRHIGLRLHTDAASGIELHHNGSTLAALLHTRIGNRIRFGAYGTGATAQNSLTTFGEFGESGGLVLGSPAGGAQGLGSLNAVSLLVNNQAVWHTGNDGSGSGLDADLLDGQQGAYYLSRTNHTGTQAWNTISGTPTTLSGYGIIDALLSAGANHRAWSSSDIDIDGLIPGSAFGSVLEGVANAHLVVGLRSNDADDSFVVLSRDNGNPTYTRLCFRVTADGRVLAGGNQVWHAGNFDPSSKSDVSHLHDGRYLQLSGGTLTGQLTVNTLVGIAPFSVSSNVKVTNLNADLLDGFDATAFLRLAVGGTVNGGTTFAASLIAQQQLDVRAQAGANSSYVATWDGSPQSGPLTLRSRTLAQFKADLGTMPVDPHNHDSTYVRLDGGNTISGNLPFGVVTRQMLNLYSTLYGIGVQSATLYLRTAQDFSVHAGGSHVDGQNAAGAGGITLLNISSVGNVARLFGAHDIWHTGNFNPSNYVPTSRQILAGTGLTGGGTLAADRTISANFGTTSNTVCAGNRGVPAGGTTGQVLKKLSATNYDLGWQDVGGASGWGSLDFYANIVMNADETGATLTTSGGGLSWISNSPTISYAELGRNGADCYLVIHIAGTQIGTNIIHATAAFDGFPGATPKGCPRIWLSGVKHNGSNLVMEFAIEGQNFKAQRFGIAGVNTP